MVTIRLHTKRPAQDPKLSASRLEVQELSERLTTLAKLAQDAVTEARVTGVELPSLKSLAEYLSEQFGESSL